MNTGYLRSELHRLVATQYRHGKYGRHGRYDRDGTYCKHGNYDRYGRYNRHGRSVDKLLRLRTLYTLQFFPLYQSTVGVETILADIHIFYIMLIEKIIK